MKRKIRPSSPHTSTILCNSPFRKLAPKPPEAYSRKNIQAIESRESVREEITLLLALQENDRQLTDRQSQVKRLEAQKAQVESTLRDEQAVVDQICQTLNQLEQTSRSKNLEVDDLDMHIRKYQQHLDEGIISFKEMEALRTKIVHQRKRISEMEDEALALMEDIEAEKTRFTGAQTTLTEREKELRASCQEINRQIAQVKEEIALAQKARAKIAEKMQSHLLNRYEKLHTEYYDPVVVITNGTCSGCNLRVSGNTVERARSDMDITTCENCSRILYVR